MKSKKIFAVLLCSSTLLSIGMPVFASEKPDATINAVVLASTTKTGDVKDLKSLCDKYGLEDVSVLPEGIIPLKFDSIEDADNYLSKVEAGKDAEKEQEIKERADSSKNLKNSSDPVILGVVKTHSETHDVGVLGSSGLLLSITCKYTTDGSKIIGVSSITSSISGDTTNYSWSQTSQSWRSLDAGETASVTITGRLTQYVVIDGKKKSFYNTYTRSSEFNS